MSGHVGSDVFENGQEVRGVNGDDSCKGGVHGNTLNDRIRGRSELVEVHCVSSDDSWLSSVFELYISDLRLSSINLSSVHHEMSSVFGFDGVGGVSLEDDISGEISDFGLHDELFGSVGFGGGNVFVFEGGGEGDIGSRNGGDGDFFGVVSVVVSCGDYQQVSDVPVRGDEGFESGSSYIGCL